MATWISLAALFVAMLALSHKHPRTLRLDRLELVNGPDKTRIEPGRVEIEREGISCVALSVLGGEPEVVGVVASSSFRLAAGDTSSLMLRDGDDLASILPNGVSVQNATTKSTLLPNCMMPGLPLDAGHDLPAMIEATPANRIKPIAALAKLRTVHAPHGLKVHAPEDEQQPA